MEECFHRCWTHIRVQGSGSSLYQGLGSRVYFIPGFRAQGLDYTRVQGSGFSLYQSSGNRV